MRDVKKAKSPVMATKMLKYKRRGGGEVGNGNNRLQLKVKDLRR